MNTGKLALVLFLSIGLLGFTAAEERKDPNEVGVDEATTTQEQGFLKKSVEAINNGVNEVAGAVNDITGGNDYQYNKEVMLTVSDDIQTRATVKLWGDVDFQSYSCYSVITGEDKFLDNEGHFNHPGILEHEKYSSGEKEGIVMNVNLNRLGEKRINPPNDYDEEANTAWANTDLAEGDILLTQCFKGSKATNLVKTDVTSKSINTGKGESENIPDLQPRYYTPEGEYTLGGETTGRENYKNKYTFTDVRVRSCNVDLQGGIESPYSGKIVVENKNSYPIQVNGHFDIDQASIEGIGGWIEPNSQKELSFEDSPGIEDFPFSTSPSTEITAKVYPAWKGSGGGSCKITCGTIGGTGETEYPESCNAGSSETGGQEGEQQPSWTQYCPDGTDITSASGKKKCIVNDLAPSCVGASNPEEYCGQAMSSLCSYLGLGYDQENTRCTTEESQTGVQ